MAGKRRYEDRCRSGEVVRTCYVFGDGNGACHINRQRIPRSRANEGRVCRSTRLRVATLPIR